MSELHLRAILAAIIYAGRASQESRLAFTPYDAAQEADKILIASLKQMVSSHTAAQKKRQAETDKAAEAAEAARHPHD